MRAAIHIFMAFLTAFGPQLAFAQSAISPDVITTFSVDKNYVKNPSAISNVLGTSTSSATIARDTDAADKLDNIASFVCDTSANGGYCEWTLNTIVAPDTAGNCSATAVFKGDASLYSLQLLDGSNTLLNSKTLTNEATWRGVEVSYPCGTSRKVRLTQTTAGTSAAVNIGKVNYGRNKNVASSIPIRDVGEIFPISGATCPAGSLPADGSVVSRSTYADLFQETGTTYGAGDGSTTFALVNTSGVFLRGDGTQTISGQAFSATRGTAQSDATSVNGMSADQPAHNHYSGAGADASVATRFGRTGHSANVTADFNAYTATYVEGINTSSSDPAISLAGDAETRPANVAVKYCVQFAKPTNVYKLSEIADTVGKISYFAQNMCPVGYLPADGSAIPAQYTRLIAAVGANTPDLDGLFIRSSGTSASIGGQVFTAGTHGTAYGDKTSVNGITADQAAHAHNLAETNGAGDSTLGASTGVAGWNNGFIKYTNTGTGGRILVESTDPAITVSSSDSETVPAHIVLKACINVGWTDSAPMIENGVVAQFPGVTRVNTAENITSSTTLSSLHDSVFVDPTSASFTLTLPPAAEYKGKEFTISNLSTTANAVTIDGNAAETICGQATIKVIGAHDSITIKSNGSSWYEAGGNRCRRVETIRVGNNGTASVILASSSWYASATRTALGFVAITPVSGLWSSVQACVCSTPYDGNAGGFCQYSNGQSPSTVIAGTYNSGGTSVDREFNMICHGYR